MAHAAAVQNLALAALGVGDARQPFKAEIVADRLDHILQRLGQRHQLAKRIAPRGRPVETATEALPSVRAAEWLRARVKARGRLSGICFYALVYCVVERVEERGAE